MTFLIVTDYIGSTWPLSHKQQREGTIVRTAYIQSSERSFFYGTFLHYIPKARCPRQTECKAHWTETRRAEGQWTKPHRAKAPRAKTHRIQAHWTKTHQTKDHLDKNAYA